MSKATPVVVVFPERTKAAASAMFSSNVISMFLAGWFVMLLAPIAFEYHASFWQALSVVVVFRLLLPSKVPPALADLKAN